MWQWHGEPGSKGSIKGISHIVDYNDNNMQTLKKTWAGTKLKPNGIVHNHSKIHKGNINVCLLHFFEVWMFRKSHPSNRKPK